MILVVFSLSLGTSLRLVWKRKKCFWTTSSLKYTENPMLGNTAETANGNAVKTGGGFGRVYRGKFEKTGQVEAIKKLDGNGLQKEQNLRLLVYEYMPFGSLEGHLLGRRAIDTTRPMKEQNLVAWAQPVFREPKRFLKLAELIQSWAKISQIEVLNTMMAMALGNTNKLAVAEAIEWTRNYGGSRAGSCSVHPCRYLTPNRRISLSTEQQCTQAWFVKSFMQS
ncbi:hypothetical protein Dimus_016592 [Dionaea muscipula]